MTGAQRLGITPDRCVVVEDALTGLEAARAAGMYAIAVTTTFPREKLDGGLAHIVVDQLAELTVTRAEDGSLTITAPR